MILNRNIREGLIRKVTYEQIHEGGKRASLGGRIRAEVLEHLARSWAKRNPACQQHSTAGGNDSNVV